MKIAIIGKGIAGLSCAYRLRHIADHITVFGSSQPEDRASSSAQGVICNKGLFESYSPLFEVKIKSTPWIKSWLKDFEVHSKQKVNQLFSGIYEPFAKHEDYQKHLKRIYKQRFRACFASQDLVGSPAEFLSTCHYLYYPFDGWFDAPQALDLMEAYLKSLGIDFLDERIEGFSPKNEGIELRNERFSKSFDRVIIAAGKNTSSLLWNSNFLAPKLYSVSGQILKIKQASNEDHFVFVRGGHSLISFGGYYHLGATSIKKSALTAVDLNEGQENLMNIARSTFGLNLNTAASISTSWGVRVRVKDRMPFWGSPSDPAICGRVWLVGGFFKNGLQFADFLARAIAKDFQGKEISSLEKKFHVQRLSNSLFKKSNRTI